MTDTLHETVLRQCTRCLENKPTSEFYKHKNGRDGLDSHCKPCSRKPAPTLTCRVCGTQWKARASGRPAKLCAECRVSHRVCFACDKAKPRNEFHNVAHDRGSQCKKCSQKTRLIPCGACGDIWELVGRGIPPKLCRRCELTLKVCHKCGEAKKHSEFNRAGGTRTGLNDACRPCAQEYFRTRGSQLKRANDLMTKYGITLDEWNSLWDVQEGKCACCSTQLASRAALDHCHDTGAVRGILCGNCNTGIGHLGDNAEGLLRAETYLWSRRDVLAELTAGLHYLSENCLA